MKPFSVKLMSTVAFALSMVAPAFAAPETLLDFEAVSSFAPIGEFYNGGADGTGHVGPALGVSFGGDALGLVNDFDTYFTHAPSPVGIMTPVGASSTMNVAAGFTQGLGLSYASSAAVTNGVQVWSGLNGTGSLLASFNLAANATTGCSDSAYCHFDQAVRTFTGTAHSVTFGNATYAAGFDNVRMGAVPEPSAWSMALAACGVLFAMSRRRV